MILEEPVKVGEIYLLLNKIIWLLFFFKKIMFFYLLLKVAVWQALNAYCFNDAIFLAERLFAEGNYKFYQ